MANQENPTPQDKPTDPLGQRPALGDLWKTEGFDTQQQEDSTRSLPKDGIKNNQHIQNHTDSKPKKVGRYPVKRLLGKGGFGEVYLGFDDQLKRDVAIKLTYGSKVGPKAAKMFMEEARILAELDHPNIVPVFDTGETETGDVFIVSKFIDGTDLATRIERDRPSRELSIEIIIKIAEALHYAHMKGLIHRDVKPANILLDKSSRPYLADFGIALRESDQVGLGEITGTPAYMSPEQARGEGHLISHQSDIFSLGLVLYELLSGRRTYQGKTTKDLIRLAQVAEIRTPRLFDSTISGEIEWICLKSLARRPSERYAIAKDFAEDLQSLTSNNGKNESGKQSNASPNTNLPKQEAETTDKNKLPTHSEGSKPTPIDSEKQLEAGIVPRGLRSFDQKDSEFFLELLPGLRDRSGLPESLRFWKDRIEAMQIEESFRVGLVYGPSGCGKSSLMKAGLLPRLSPKIERIYIEATPENTLIRLHKEIQKKVPEAAKYNLVETLSLIRRRKLVPNGGKLLLVIDQFEQWLHAHHDYSNQELADVLRQCDGETIQAILMVRDDFYSSVNRFFHDLDVPMIESENVALVDLFDLYHAKHVLELFGQAYKRLPKDRSSWSEQQKQFLQTAVEGLSENRRVISVRLALFAEMMKSREWVPKSIQEVGGVSGVGVRFLEETFGDKYATIQIRKHQQAVRGILSGLLPSTGTDIKGHNRSSTELQKAVGYETRPNDFAELIRLLDKDLRLITPTDESGNENRSYQLTHDYLVPSLREWLNQKQRETKKGRAELKLAERAATWGANPEAKQLPTVWEWMRIRRWTEQAKWKKSERTLMQAANRHHLTKIALAATLILGLFFCGLGFKKWVDDRDAESLVRTIETAEFDKLAVEFNKLQSMRPGIDVKLKDALRKTHNDSDVRLKLSLALLPSDPSQADFVIQRLQTAQAPQVKLILEQLSPYRDGILDKLWVSVENEDKTSGLPVASALAAYDPGNQKWRGISARITNSLVKENTLRLGTWIEMLRPVATHLNPHLAEIYLAKADENRTQAHIDLATDILEMYANSDFHLLHDLLMQGTAPQFARLFHLYEAFRAEASLELQKELAVSFRADPNATKEENEKKRLQLISRQANASVALVRLENPKSVYKFLTVDRDPEALSQFIYRIRGRDVSPSLLISSLREIKETSTPVDNTERQQHYLRIYGMLLGLGEFAVDQLPAIDREKLLEELFEMYANHPSRAVHSATGWLLRKWGEKQQVRKIDQTPLDYDPSGIREWYVIEISPPKSIESKPETTVGAELNAIDLFSPVHLTMIVFPGGELKLGESAGREKKEIQGPIAVLDRELTWGQYSPFDLDMHRKQFVVGFNRNLSENDPVFALNWFEAVNYCRQLTMSKMHAEEFQCFERKSFFSEGEKVKVWLEVDDNLDWECRMDVTKPGFRLPTDEEWEYVTRYGTETEFCFGSTQYLMNEYGWNLDNSGKTFHPLGRMRPNLGGLFDVQGNLWEMSGNQYDNGVSVLVIGGGFYDEAIGCCPWNRRKVRPTNRGYCGLRLVLNPALSLARSN